MTTDSQNVRAYYRDNMAGLILSDLKEAVELIDEIREFMDGTESVNREVSQRLQHLQESVMFYEVHGVVATHDRAVDQDHPTTDVERGTEPCG